VKPGAIYIENHHGSRQVECPNPTDELLSTAHMPSQLQRNMRFNTGEFGTQTNE
jgi:hypothetical protein